MTAAFVTGLQGGKLMVWHGRLGVLLGGLFAFRLAWGVVGSTHARFSHFVRGTDTIRAYLRLTSWQRDLWIPGRDPDRISLDWFNSLYKAPMIFHGRRRRHPLPALGNEN